MELPFLGVHRAEWLRLANDVPEYLFPYSVKYRCMFCQFTDTQKCERCVLDRVEYLIKLRRSKFRENTDEVKEPPF